jgi:Rhs element Vgr protein
MAKEGTLTTRIESLSGYSLDILNADFPADVLRFRGREALSEPFSWKIEFTSPPGSVRPEQVLMKFASFRMLGGKVVHGIVTGMEWLSTTVDRSHYSVTLESRLALFSRTRRSAVFPDQSVSEVVEHVLRAHGLEGPDFEFRLSRDYPVREVITQWRETDLEFIQRILAEVGIWFRYEMNAVTELDIIIFGDTQLQYVFDVNLPYREPSGLSAEECVWGVRTWNAVVPGGVHAKTYHYQTATTPMDAHVSVRNDAVTTGEHYRYGEPYREDGDDTDPEPATESGAFYARLHHERELNKSARLHLFSNASHLTPGQVLEPQGNIISALKEGVLMTQVTFIGSRDSRLHVSVWGQPYTERYCFRPVCPERPEIHVTLPARIESREKHDIYAHLDEFGRYRVKLNFDRDDREQGYGYLWLRMAKPYTGEQYGWHTPLIDGTEVAIAYSNGDIDLPYISHAMHDSEHADIVNRDNRSQNILRTAAHNELRLEDKRGEEHIQLSTEFAKTQLNSGHIVDTHEKPRGKGFELRTDERGVMRVAKGLFISADGQQKAAGEVLDMGTALKEIDICLQQIQQLEMAAEQAQALKADVDAQIRMFEQRLKPLNEVLHFSAPEGIALTSGEHMQLAASRNVAINAGDDISVGVMGNMTALAGDKIGMFAHSGQMSLKAGEGPIEMQAQNGNMRLFAEKKLTLTSEGDISFAGKKRITLIGGGSYLKLDAGKVEYGTTATYMRKMKRTMFAASQAQPLPEVKMPSPAVMREVNPETAKLWVTPVFAKSCLKEEGCTDAGTATEPADNFGEMALLAQQDACYGYNHTDTDNPEEPEQHAQAARRKPATDPGTSSYAQAGMVATAGVSRAAATEAGVGVMTRIGGSAAAEGVLAANPVVVWAGVLYSALYVPSAGAGSDKVPGRDEYWYEEELRGKAISGAKATTRVRFFWQPDIHGKMQVYGVHTGEGTQYEGVRVANMLWNDKTRRFEFTPAKGADGPLITWTPGKPEGTDHPTHTGTATPTIDQPTILVNPIPENQGESTTPPFPVPDEKDFNDYILVFPADSGVKPIYVYLSEQKTSYAHGHKHYPPKNKTWDEIIKSTKSGPAKFKPGVNIESTDHDVWESGEPTTNGQNWKLKEFDDVQGAYKGKETKWVVTKESQGTIHSHPIGVQEAGKLTK